MPSSFLKRIIEFSLFAIFIAVLYAVRFSHFVPSPLGLQVALGVATMFGIGGVILAFKRLRSPSSGYRNLTLLGKVLRPLIVWPLFCLVCFVLPYLAFKSGFPAWYTAAFGSPGERLVTVTQWPTFASPNTISLSQKSAAMARPGSTLLVRGPATAFGINVETISLSERAAVPPPQTLPPVPAPVPPAAPDARSSVGELAERGRKAYADKNYSEAMRWYRMAADQGDAAAQLNVGGLYAAGQGAPQNYSEAMQWFRKAAEEGYPAAQNDIGSLYASGRGVPRNYSEAMRWFQMAAGQGYAPAQSNIGALYESGWGVSLDYAEAMRWFRMAAAQGHAVAQNSLGWMIARGEGAPKDCTAAKQWFEKAAAAGLDLARSHLSTGAKGACLW